jgi:hypothetical protein
MSVAQQSSTTYDRRSCRKYALTCMAVLSLLLTASAGEKTLHGESDGAERMQETYSGITYVWLPSLPFSPIDHTRSVGQSARKAKAVEAGPVALEQRRQGLLTRLKGFQEAGQMDLASRVKAKLEQLEFDQGMPASHQETTQAKPLSARDSAEMRHQLHHLELAIENLHSAGLHDMAENLVRKAQRMRQRMRAQIDTPSMPSAPVDELRAEVRDLRAAVKELQRQMREMGQMGR